MDTQTEPLDLSMKSGSNNKILSIIDFKFLAGLNSHLARLYERTQLVKKGFCLPRDSRHGAKNVLPCQVCLKTFDRPSLLKRHMRTHTGNHHRIYSYPVPYIRSQCWGTVGAVGGLKYASIPNVRTIRDI